MGLLHWWTLNNTLEDKVGDLTLVNWHNATFSSGKVTTYSGQTTRGSSNNTEKTFYHAVDFTSVSTSLSVSFWININSDLTSGYCSPFLIGPWSAYEWPTVRFGLVYYYASNKLVFAIADGTNYALADSSSTNITLSRHTWYHITAVYNYRNSISLYVNGQKVAETTTTLVPTLTDYYCIGGNATQCYAFNGLINDVRIYNEALSEFEIKELAKGLCLHYTFDSEESNLLTSDITLENGVTIDNTSHPFPGHGPIYKLTQSGNLSNVYKGIYETVSNVKPGDKITLSCWIYTENKASCDAAPELRCYQIKSGGGSTNWYGLNWLDDQIDGKWCYYSIQYTLDSDMATTIFSANIVKNGTYWITGIKVEYGTTATPWTGFKNISSIPTNLVSSIESSFKQNIVIDGINAVHTNGNNTDTYFKINLNKPLIPGKKYYIKCNVSGFNNNKQFWRFGICAQSYSNLNSITFQNGECEGIFEYKDSQWTTPTQILLDDYTTSSGLSRAIYIYITNIEIYELPYLIDETGYRNNALVIAEPLKIKADNDVCYYAAKSDGESKVITHKLPFTSTGFTVAIWVKDSYETASDWWCGLESSDNNMYVNFGPNGTKEVQFAVFKHTNGDLYQTIQTPDQADKNNWVHWVGTFDGSKARLYKNGIKVQETTTVGSYNDLAAIDCSYLFGSPGKMTTEEIADFRLYTTKFSDEDVKKLYQNSAIIDNKYNLYSNCICEKPDNTSEIKVRKNSIELKNNISENFFSHATILEYIESTGTQYIDTGITASSTNKYILKISKQTEAGGILGSDDHWGGFFMYNLAQNRFCFHLPNKQFNITGITDEILDINCSPNGLVINEQSGTEASDNNSYAGTLKLYPKYQGGYLRGKFKLYYCKLYDNDTIVRDFVPCYDFDSEQAGLYDFISGEFYTNQGTGEFIAGNPKVPDEYQNVEYIGTGDSQYINTNSYVTPNTAWELTFSLNNDDFYKQIAGMVGSPTSQITIYSTTGSPDAQRVIAVQHQDYDGPFAYINIDQNKHRVYLSSGKQAVDDIVVNNTNVTVASTTPILIGCRYQSGPSGDCNAKFYACKIWEDNTLIKYLVPCYRKSDTKRGMYDIIENVFYTNNRGGSSVPDFTYGEATDYGDIPEKITIDKLKIYKDKTLRVNKIGEF